MNKSILIDSGDVKVVAFRPEECDICTKRATHEVRLDLRNNGIEICVGRYCKACAHNEADSLRASLHRTEAAV